jgi:2,4-dienoyl-CoA reductase-like NADH-dependent reductase (Old Yellow Enzyme family)
MSTESSLLFQPLKIRGVELPNRVVVSPMAMYTADNGYPSVFHLLHYGKFALGGAGTVFLEEHAVMRAGRMTNGCLGLWEDGQIDALRPITAALRAQGSIPAIQIAHGGRKSSMQRAWEGNGPLTAENIANGDEQWVPQAPSALPLAPGWLVPRALTGAEMDDIRAAFVAAALRGVAAGFDIVELHLRNAVLEKRATAPVRPATGG